MLGFAKRKTLNAENIAPLVEQTFRHFDKLLEGICSKHKVPSESVHDLEKYYIAVWIVQHLIFSSLVGEPRKTKLLQIVQDVGNQGLINQVALEQETGSLSSTNAARQLRQVTLNQALAQRVHAYNELCPWPNRPRPGNELAFLDMQNWELLAISMWKNLTFRTIVKKNAPEVMAALEGATLEVINTANDRLISLLK